MHYANYTGLSMAQLRNSLIRQGMKPEERQRLMEEVADYRKKMRSQAARALYVRNAWNKYAEPLAEEIQRVRVAQHYRANKRRSVVLLRYRELLDLLMENFRTWANENKRAPQEIAEKNGVPNKGAHWVDWVDHIYADEKEMILEDFELVREHGRKLYKPFQRRADKDDSVGHTVPQED